MVLSWSENFSELLMTYSHLSSSLMKLMLSQPASVDIGTYDQSATRAYSVKDVKDGNLGLMKKLVRMQTRLGIGDITGLGAFELDVLQDWEYKFIYKYVKVRTIKKPEDVERYDLHIYGATQMVQPRFIFTYKWRL